MRIVIIKPSKREKQQYGEWLNLPYLFVMLGGSVEDERLFSQTNTALRISWNRFLARCLRVRAKQLYLAENFPYDMVCATYEVTERGTNHTHLCSVTIQSVMKLHVRAPSILWRYLQNLKFDPGWCATTESGPGTADWSGVSPAYTAPGSVLWSVCPCLVVM